MCSDRRTRAVSRLASSVLPLAALALTLVACGKQGDPQPKPRAVPQKGNDLVVRQRGLELLLEVGYPKATVAGLPLEGLASATLYEVMEPATTAGKAPTLSETELEGLAKPVVELTGDALDQAVAGDKLRFKVELTATDLGPIPPPIPVTPPTATAPATATATAAATAAPAAAAAGTAPAPTAAATSVAGSATPPAATTPVASVATPAPSTPATPAASVSAPAVTAPAAAAPPATASATTAPVTTPAAAASPAVGTTTTTPTAVTPAAPILQARIYAVRTKERRGLDSPWSNIVGIVPRVTPAPPGAFTVAAQKEGVSLKWTAAADAVGYVVLRREATDPEWRAPLTTLPASAITYLDRAAVYGTRYVYSVLSMTQVEPAIESAPQSASEVDYRDLFAPATPTELRALLVAGQVRLVWEPSPDADLRGYTVQRSVAGGPFTNALPDFATGSDTTDPNPPAHSKMRYRLIAVDLKGNAAPPTEPVEITVP